MDFWVVFLTGLTLGGLSCSLIQIGLFSTNVSNEHKKFYWNVSSFLITRIVTAMLLGLVLGLLGTSVLIPDGLKLFFQLIAGLIMVFTALSFTQIKLPTELNLTKYWRWVSNGIFKIINSHSLFSPIALGIISLFIPCGAMIAVESAALVTGNPLQSALLLGVFILGTIPTFLGIGLLSKLIKTKYQRLFTLVIGVFLFIFGIVTINGVLVLINSPITLQKIYAYSPIQLNEENSQLSGFINAEGEREITINVYPEGYAPTMIYVGLNEQIKLILKSHNIYNCSSLFKIPAKKISHQLPPEGETTISFIADQPGSMQFSCATGLKTGVIEVVES